MKKYNTNLASEYYVLSMLYRKGIEAYLTVGNKKSVDIIIQNQNRVFTVDVKGIRGTTLFPLDSFQASEGNPNHLFVFVSFLKKITDHKTIPECYIVPVCEIESLLYHNPKGNRKGVTLSTLRKNKYLYKNRWEFLYGFSDSFTVSEKLEIDKSIWFDFLSMYNVICKDYQNIRDYQPIPIEQFYEIANQVEDNFDIDFKQLTIEALKFKTLLEIDKKDEKYSVYNSAIEKEISRRVAEGEVLPDKSILDIVKGKVSKEAFVELQKRDELRKKEKKDRKRRTK